MENISWINKGGGSFRMPNKRLIKPGERFEAHMSDIPAAFMDVVVPADKEMQERVRSQKDNTPDIVVHPTFEVRERSTGTGYDVFDQNNKKRNTKVLTFEAAQELVETLGS